MTWLSGSTAVEESDKPTKVTAGVGFKGNDRAIVLIVETPDYLTPVAVAITPDQASILCDQLVAALGEASASAPPASDEGA